MKSLLLAFGLIAVTGLWVNGQNVAFVNGNAENLPDTVYIVHDLSETEYLKDNIYKLEDVYVVNKTNSALQVKIKREIIQYVTDSAYIDKWGEGDFEWVKPGDQLCWGDNCFNLTSEQVTFETENSELKTDTLVTFEGKVEYVHYKIVGKTILKYSIVNGSQVEDQLFVVYQITGSTTSKPDVNNVRASIYPNPVRGTLNISNLDKAQKVLVSNILGQPVFSTVDIESNMQVDFSNLNNGVYFVSIYYPNNKVVTQRLVKQ